MTTRRESVLIEISEDAYKQNSVYRPWDDSNLDGSSAYPQKTSSHASSSRNFRITKSQPTDQSDREQELRLAP
jgi:hypothetical protein